MSSKSFFSQLVGGHRGSSGWRTRGVLWLEDTGSSGWRTRGVIRLEDTGGPLVGGHGGSSGWRTRGVLWLEDTGGPLVGGHKGSSGWRTQGVLWLEDTGGPCFPSFRWTEVQRKYHLPLGCSCTVRKHPGYKECNPWVI